jgi:uncharacterized protein
MQIPTAGNNSFHVMTKPIGPICNIDCKYCFYLEKEKLYPAGEKWKMSDEVLESYIRQYIEAQAEGSPSGGAPEISFAWQGGEPTLLGVDYFRRVVELQRKYAGGKRIGNAFQTNGILLDDAWGEFFRENDFLIGLSVDGPRELHDHYRVDKKGAPTFDAVMRGLSVLKKHRVEFNTLTVVNRGNSQKPLEVYEFLKEIGSGFIQFIPLIERVPDRALKVLGYDLAPPPEVGDEYPVTPWSVRPTDYGEFLVKIFDSWVRRDVGRVFVQLFDVALAAWMGMPAGLCVFAEKCGSAMALEHNGDLYSCDHYVYPKYKLGNIMNHSLREMVDSPQQKKFGSDKADTLPAYCRGCEVKFACNGECPKHRFLKTPDGESGLNYLCAAYKRFFNHVDPHMKTMAQLLQARRSPAMIMEMIAEKERKIGVGSAGRNEPCPCGSGRKFKKCCGA